MEADYVSVDGNGVTFVTIHGKPTLDLRNIKVDTSEGAHEGPVITKCRNIVSSNILVRSSRTVTGIEELYGKVDDTTTIELSGSGNVNVVGISSVPLTGNISGGTFTITSSGNAFGVDVLHGTISGGRFSVTGSGTALGVGTAHGDISGGEFSVTGSKHTWGIGTLHGTISGGKFTATCTGTHNSALGVGTVLGTISRGEFIVTGTTDRTDTFGVGTVGGNALISGNPTFTVQSREDAFGVGTVNENGRISGGKFTVTGSNLANGIGSSDRHKSGMRGNALVSGGEFCINGKNEANGISYFGSSNAKVSGGTFWSKGGNGATGIYSFDSNLSTEVALTGGTFYAWGPNEDSTAAIGGGWKLGNSVYIPCHVFTYLCNNKNYAKNANRYIIPNDGTTFFEIYDRSATCPEPIQATTPTPAPAPTIESTARPNTMSTPEASGIEGTTTAPTR